MAQASRTFRIFVSSTFSDLKAERDALQREVFPRLRELCLQHGCRFQAIDLRWGVSEEASFDQQTMKICLEELHRCQRVTPRPNFIVLLGDRYGWRPLPYQIPASEFEAIRNRLADTPARELLAVWYRRDDNALYTAGDQKLPGVYVLQPRTGGYEDYDRWETEVERPLGRALAQVARELDLPPAARMKYQASAVAQEIAHGALDPEIADAPGHVFGFFRTLKGLPLEQAITDRQLKEDLKGFVDLEDDGRVDEEAQRSLKVLRDDLAARLPGNLHFYEADWQGQGGVEDRPPITTAHLEGLCRDVYDCLSRVILEQIEKLEKADPVDQERAAHEDFGQERARHFLGRAVPLVVIADYLAGESPQPLAVLGEGGSGKSALLAQAARAARATNPKAVVVARFIGATPASSDIRLLLESLCREISRAYGVRDDDLPVEFRKLEEEFPRRLALATLDKPLLLILDALDQLSDAEQARRLYWLPDTLPPHVRLLISAIPGEIRDILEKKLPTGQLLELAPMTTGEGDALLELWLQEAGCTLQPYQRQEVLSKFAANGLPLYLRLAFEEARHWRSYETPDQTRLSPDIPGMIRDLFRRLSQPAHHGEVLVSRSLGYLAAGKNGLTEDELLEVLSRDEEVMKNFGERSSQSPPVDRLPVAVWSRLHFDLEPYLTERQADGAALLAFYHRQLEEVVKEDYLFGPEKNARHATLAVYFQEQDYWCESPEDQGRRAKTLPPTPRPVNVRKVDELPWQVLQTEEWDKLENLLTDLAFLEAKVEAGRVFDLSGNFFDAMTAIPDSSVERSPIEALYKVIDANSHVLKQHPTLLFQQVYNALIWDWDDSTTMGQKLSEAEQSCRPAWLKRLCPPATKSNSHLMRTILLHDYCIESIRVSADGNTVTSTSNDGTIFQWEMNTGAMLRQERRWPIELPRPDNISLNGLFLVRYNRQSSQVLIYDAVTGKELYRFEAETYFSVNCLAVADDGRRVVGTAWDQVIFWDAESGAVTKWHLIGNRWILSLIDPQRYYRPRNPGALAVAMAPDGQTIAIGNASGEIILMNIKTGEESLRLKGHERVVSALTFARDRQVLISGGDDKRIIVWNLRISNSESTVEGNHGPVTAAAISYDGRTIVIGYEDGNLTVWDADILKIRMNLSEMYGSVDELAFSPNDQFLVSSSHDREGGGNVFLFDMSSGKSIGRWNPTGTASAAVDFSTDGSMLGFMDSRGIYGVNLIPYEGCQSIQTVGELQARMLIPRDAELFVSGCSLKFSLDGHTVVMGGEGSVSLWDLRTRKRSAIFLGHGALAGSRERVFSVYALAFSADGGMLASGSKDGTIILWDVTKGVRLRRLIGHNGPVWCLAISSDGRFLASGSDDRSLILWEVGTGGILARLPLLDQVQACRFDNNQEVYGGMRLRLVTVGRVRTVPDIWHLELVLYDSWEAK